MVIDPTEPPAFDRRTERGPFDIIGDVHGCADELETLLERLGYTLDTSGDDGPCHRHPTRRAVFVGDLVDRGPRILDALRIAERMVLCGAALAVPGNHEAKLLRKLRGASPRIGPGLRATLDEIEAVAEPARTRLVDRIGRFLATLPSHLLLDEGRLVVAHAGLTAELQGRRGRRVLAFALYGDVTGERDARGFPVRRDWAAHYDGEALVVYGHTPVTAPRWRNETVNIDTGCVFGGALTALRYPERETLAVPAARRYFAVPEPAPTAAEDP